MLSTLILAALLADSPPPTSPPARYVVEVRTGDHVDRYLAIARPVVDGERLVFRVEESERGAAYRSGPATVEVSVPAARASVVEVREKGGRFR